MKRFIFFSALMVLFSAPAMAQDEVVERFETNFGQAHDRGLYFRLGAGVLYGQSDIIPQALGQPDESKDGWLFGYDAHLGGFVAGQLVVHASQWSEVQSDRAHMALGLGLTYYLHEQKNWFISSMLGPSLLYDQAPDIHFGDQVGLSAGVSFGTGWWIADDWVMGFALNARGHHVDFDGDGIYSTAWFAGLNVNVSLN